MQKALDKAGKNVYNIRNLRENAIGISQEYLEKYSRGRRGAPAKGVGRLYRRESSNLSFSAKKSSRNRKISGLFLVFSPLFEIQEKPLTPTVTPIALYAVRERFLTQNRRLLA